MVVEKESESLVTYVEYETTNLFPPWGCNLSDMMKNKFSDKLEI